MTLTEKLDRVPPIFVRLLASRDGLIISNRELMRRTGWSPRKLRRVYCRVSWAGVSVGDIDTFLSACGMNWAKQRRKRTKLKKWHSKIHMMPHLVGKLPWQASQRKRLLHQLEQVLLEASK